MKTGSSSVRYVLRAAKPAITTTLVRSNISQNNTTPVSPAVGLRRRVPRDPRGLTTRPPITVISAGSSRRRLAGVGPAYRPMAGRVAPGPQAGRPADCMCHEPLLHIYHSIIFCSPLVRFSFVFTPSVIPPGMPDGAPARPPDRSLLPLSVSNRRTGGSARLDPDRVCGPRPAGENRRLSWPGPF